MSRRASYLFAFAGLVAFGGMTACDRGFSIPWGVPDAVGSIHARPRAGGISVDWDRVPGAETYELFLATDPTLSPQNVGTRPDGRRIPDVQPPHRVNGLDPAKEWHFLVVAANAEGAGDASPTVAARPIPIERDGLAPRVPAQFAIDSEMIGAHLGRAVAFGDFDGDGFADLAAGAPDADLGGSIAGMVRVHPGSPDGPAADLGTQLDGTQSGALFGAALAACDLDADGYDDLAVGEPLYAPQGGGAEGRVVLFFGSRNGLSSSAGATTGGASANAAFGAAISCGDLDGDGMADLVVGSPGHSGTLAGEGAVHVFFGGPDGIAQTPGFSAFGGQTDAAFGSAVSAAGDVDGDGIRDLLVGAPAWDDPGLVDTGKASWFAGAPTGPASPPGWERTGGQANGLFGFSVALVESVDGDHLDEVLVGMPGFDPGGAPGTGAARMWSGRGTGPGSTPVFADAGTAANTAFGIAVASAGDANGDGYGDLVIGAPGFSDGQSDEGALYYYPGANGGSSAPATWVQASDVADAWLGYAIAAGDVDGDGSDDLLAGMPLFEDGQSEEGRVALFRGAPSAGPLADPGRVLRAPAGGRVALRSVEIDPAKRGENRHCVVEWGDGSAPSAPADPCTTAGVEALGHVYPAPGTYVVHLRVDDGLGVVGEGAVTVSVEP